MGLPFLESFVNVIIYSAIGLGTIVLAVTTLSVVSWLYYKARRNR